MAVENREAQGFEPEPFRAEIHTVQAWLESVAGPLRGRRFGVEPGAPEAPLAAEERDRLITLLCNYLVGEAAALEGASGLIRIAPDRGSQIFLATQVIDEARHLEVFRHRLADLAAGDPEMEIRHRADPQLLQLKVRLEQLIDHGEWEAALFAHTVVLEAMELATFRHHLPVADPITRQLLQSIVEDERRHIGFGEDTLGRRLQLAPELRTRIRELRQELDRLVLDAFERGASSMHLSVAGRTRLGASYLAVVARLGVGA